MIFCFKPDRLRWAFLSTSSLDVFCFILGYPIQSTFLFNQVFLSISDHPSGSIGDLESLLNHLVNLGLSRSFALYGARWISYYTIRVYLWATRLENQDYVVSSAITTILKRWKVEADVCTKEIEPCCVQLAVLSATTVAPNGPANSMQQSD